MTPPKRGAVRVAIESRDLDAVPATRARPWEGRHRLMQFTGGPGIGIGIPNSMLARAAR